MGVFGLIFILMTSASSYASPYGKRSGRLAFDVATSFLSTTENLDSSGDIVDLDTGKSYEEIKTKIRAEYDYSRNTTFFSSLIVNSATSTDANFERSETAPSKASIGFDYVLYRKNFLITPSFEIRLPLKTYDENTDDILLNNNSIDLESLLHVVKRFRSFYLRAYTGFTYRTEGLSWLIPLGAEALYHSKRFSLGGGIESYFSVTDDDYKSNETRRTNVTDRVNGGSLIYYAVNPSLTKAYAFANYYIEPQFYIGAGLKQALFGENSAYGTEYFANLGFSFGGERAKKLPNLKADDFENDNDEFEFRFEEEVDKDVDVFNDRRNKIRYRESPRQKLKDVEQELEIKLKRHPQSKPKKRIKKDQKKKELRKLSH